MPDRLLARFLAYAQDIGLSVERTEPVAPRLPAYLAGRYQLRSATIGGQSRILLLARGEPEPPGRLRRQVADVVDRLDLRRGDVCVVLPGYSLHGRRQLVGFEIAHCIPGKILYWPGLGWATTAVRPRRAHVDAPAVLRPATQQTLLAFLLDRLPRPCTVGQLHEALGYAPITASRSAADLVEKGWLRAVDQGRMRLLELARPAAEVWAQAEPLLESPVAQVLHVPAQSLPGLRGLAAGVSALALKTDLAAPETEERACALAAWRALAHEVPTTDRPDVDSVTIQLWKYPPETLSDTDIVDALSLSLSLRDAEDPRLERSVEQLMESMSWSSGSRPSAIISPDSPISTS